MWWVTKGRAGGAAGDRLQHRRLDLHEAALDHEAPDRRDHPGAYLEHAPRLRIHDQIDVALPVARFEIGETVELVGQRSQALGQQLGLTQHDVEIALAGFVHRAAAGNDIADIPALDIRQQLIGQALLVDVELDLPGDVLNHDERAALAHHPPGDRGLTIQRLQRRLVVLTQLGLQLSRQAVAAEGVGEGTAALLRRALGVPPACRDAPRSADFLPARRSVQRREIAGFPGSPCRRLWKFVSMKSSNR